MFEKQSSLKPRLKRGVHGSAHAPQFFVQNKSYEEKLVIVELHDNPLKSTAKSGHLPSFSIYVNSFIYYLIYYILNTWKGWFKAVIFWNQHRDMLWSRESDVVADRQDDLLRLWRSTNSID